METNQRNRGIDTIRGFLLVIMAFDHFIGMWNIFPNFRWIVLTYTFRPLGFVSALEGFIFISGLTATLVYLPRLVNRGRSIVQRSILLRTGKIYLWHAITAIWVGLLFLLCNSLTNNLSDTARVGHSLFINSPLIATIKAISFAYFPPNSAIEILPMYIFFLGIFVLLIPFIVSFRYWVALASVLLWCASFLRFDLLGLHWPVMMESFNLFSYQVLFFGGAMVGIANFLRPGVMYPRNNSWLIWLQISVPVIVVFVFFLIRRNLVLELSSETQKVLLNRDELTPWTLLNCAALFYVIGYFIVRFGHRIGRNWFAFLGQNSLEVFSFHIGLGYSLLIFKNKINSANVIIQLSVLGMALISLSIPAIIRSRLTRSKAVAPRELLASFAHRLIL